MSSNDKQKPTETGTREEGIELPTGRTNESEYAVPSDEQAKGVADFDQPTYTSNGDVIFSDVKEEHDYSCVIDREDKHAMSANQKAGLVEVYAQSPLGGTSTPTKHKSYDYSYAYADVKNDNPINNGEYVEVDAQSSLGGTPAPDTSHEYSYAYVDQDKCLEVYAQSTLGGTPVPMIDSKSPEYAYAYADVKDQTSMNEVHAQSQPGGATTSVKDRNDIYSYAYADTQISNVEHKVLPKPTPVNKDGWVENVIYPQ